MFRKFATSKVVEVFDYSDLVKYTQRVGRSTSLQKLAGFIPVAPVSRNYLYLVSEAIHSYESHGWNNNFDAFESEELLRGYPTFVTAGVYRDHDNEDATKAVGICLDAWPINGEYVDVLMALSRKRAPEECVQIESGELKETSMGVVVGRAICSICENVASDETQFCSHVKEGKGRHVGDQVVFEYNKDLNFFENTLISPYNEAADPDAKIRQVLASRQKSSDRRRLLTATIPLLQEVLSALRSEEEN